MATQVCNFVSVRLDETNYPSWLYLMHHHIRGHGLLKFIDGSHPCPSQFRIADDGSITLDHSMAYERWVQHDSILISMITNTLSDDALTLVIGCETSLKVWSALKQHYAPQSEFHIMRLKSTLHNIRKGLDSIDKYLLCFKEVQNQLDVVGNRMSDDDMKTLILAGLPSEYAHTRQIIRSKNYIAMEEVRCLLLSAESEIELMHGALPLSYLISKNAQNGLVNSPHNMQYGIPNIGTSSRAFFPSQYTGDCSLAPSLHTAASSIGLIHAFNHYNSSSTALNVHHYNAPSPSSTTQFGIQQQFMPSSTVLNVPNVHSQCEDMLSFSTNTGGPRTMPNSGFMWNNSVGTGSYFSPPTPSSDFALQTGGFPSQDGGLMVQNGDYTPASQYICSQQGFSLNNGVYSNMPEQQKSFSQAASNSCSDGGYTEHIAIGHRLEELDTKEARRTHEFHTLSERVLESASQSSNEMEAAFEAPKRSQNVKETPKIDGAYVTESGNSKFLKGGVRPLKT